MFGLRLNILNRELSRIVKIKCEITYQILSIPPDTNIMTLYYDLLHEYERDILTT